MNGRLLLAILAVSALSASSLAQEPSATPYIPKKQKYSPKAEKTKERAQGPYAFSTYDTNRGSGSAFFGTTNPDLEEESLEMDRVRAQNYGQASGSQDALFGPDASSKVHNFEGIRAPDGLTPADNDAAVYGDWMVQVVNSSWAIYDKCGNRTHFEGFDTTVNSTNFLFDPKVIFDPWSQRWVMLIHENTSSAAWLDIIVSDDSNPNGNWWFYRLNTETAPDGNVSWSDYYELGYSANALYLAGNQFRQSNNAYTGAQMVLIDKAEAYAQATTSIWRFQWYSSDNTSDRFAMRPAEMMSMAGGDYDMIFTSTNRLGGTHLHVMKFADPFGAQTFTYNDINIANYTLAPNAIQPVNDTLVGFDARVMNTMHVGDSVNGTGTHVWLGFMVQHNWGSGNVMAFRVVNFNPSTNAIRMDDDWGADGLHYMFPYLVGNYRGEGAVFFGRCGPAAPNYPEMRYSPIENVSGTLTLGGSSRIHPDNPNSSYGSNRWGDYFGGSLDWGDYMLGGGTSSGEHKIWFYGMYAFSSGTWGSGAGAIQIDSAVGALTVSNPNPVYYYSAGSVGTPTTTFNISTTSDIGVFFEMTSKPSWLTATSATTGEVYDSASGDRDVTLQVNAGADALAFGRHVGTVVFQNCYTGATYNRSVTLSLGAYHCPASFTVLDGVEFGGGIADVCSRNNQYHRFLSDEATLETDLWYTFPSMIDGADYLYWYVEAKSLRVGLTQVIYLWNSPSWEQVDGRVGPTVDTYINGVKNPGDAYVLSTGQAYIRIQTMPTNDEDPATDGWVLDVDYAQLYEYP